MAKYYGTVGFAETEETRPGVWEEVITERNYKGELIRNTRRWQTTDKVNDDLTVSNQISIVADPYAYKNFYQIRYATFCGSKWKVTNVEVQYPRLILEVGGLYNGPQT